MKIKQLYLWQMRITRNAILTFYGIMALIYTLFVVLFSVSSFNGGSDMATAISVQSTPIFVGVMSISLFPVTFKFAMANGVSRKTLLITQTLSIFSTAVAATLFDALLGIVSTNIINVFIQGKITIQSNFIAVDYSSISSILNAVIIIFGLYLMLGFAGLFLIALNNRMSKVIKLFVYIGVPTIAIVATTLIAIFGGANLHNAISSFVNAVWKFISINTFNAVLVSILFAAFFGALSVICIRRAPLKTV